MGNRYITHFTDIAGTISYTFPDTEVEQQVEQQFDAPLSRGIGADYAHDHLGYGLAPRNVKLINIRATHWQTTAALLQSDMDEAQAECYRIGKGYLYRLDEDGVTSRRCLARITAAPTITYRLDGFFGTMPAGLTFVALTDWQSTSATTGSQLIDTPNESVTIANGGNLPVTDITFRLRNTTTTRSHKPILFNVTTGQYLSLNRVMQFADDELYYATATRLAQFSATNGASYSNIYSSFAGTDFRLNPGNNTIKVCCGRPHILPWLNTIADPDFTLEWSFTARYS